jgi:hypothetical protein
MKFYFGKYKNNWLSPYTIIDTVMFWREIDYNEPLVKRWAHILDPVCVGLQWVSNKVNPQHIYVKIDNWDIWSLDHTLAYVILPSLKLLREKKHGSPMVDEEDVPVHLQSASFKKAKKRKPKHEGNPDIHAVDMDNDDTLHDRWDWVLGEIIWAFEQKMDDDADSKFFDHSECGPIENFLDDINGHLSRSKYDKEGHQAWQDRKANGFRLFGKYFEALWD